MTAPTSTLFPPDPERTLWSRGLLPPRDVDAYFVWPRGGNTGDLVLSHGCVWYLEERGLQYWISDGSIEAAALAGDVGYIHEAVGGFSGLICFPGGGNIGRYINNSQIRAAVISMLSADSHCLVFPNTFFAPEAALAHPQVTVWSRDATSWQELSRWGARSVLVPDAAFALDAAMPKYPDGQGTYLIVRQDAESIGLTIDPTTVPGASPSRFADLTLESTIPELVSALAPVEFVISDRLHGGLVALLLGKKAILLPVDYHKIRSFYDTWLVNVPSVGFARDVADAARLLPELGDRTVDLTELFRAYADPALDDVLSRLGSGIAHGRHTVGARS